MDKVNAILGWHSLFPNFPLFLPMDYSMLCLPLFGLTFGTQVVKATLNKAPMLVVYIGIAMRKVTTD